MGDWYNERFGGEGSHVRVLGVVLIGIVQAARVIGKLNKDDAG